MRFGKIIANFYYFIITSCFGKAFFLFLAKKIKIYRFNDLFFCDKRLKYLVLGKNCGIIESYECAKAHF